MQQRRDIQGLRAYAVIAVMLYHFGVPGFAGGFSGVDVFFVISGYLMTAAVLPGVTTGTFSLSKFYLARARRILPALAVVTAALFVFGWWWLAPSDYATLGWHGAGAVGLSSNFVFFAESGYFDAPSQSKWLLHTWSLSLECQFYLLYPLLLMLVARLNKPALKGTLIGLALVSFAASVLLTPKLASFTFFMLPTRAWELAIGGLVYLYAPVLSARLSKRAEIAGIALIVAGAHFLSNLLPWPGAYAALPVIGSVLVLLAARQRSLLTGTAVAQALGAWSYSIYLWHWPIYAGLRYFALTSPTALALGMVASIAAGAASYYLIEQPARHHFRHGGTAALVSITLIALFISVGAQIRHAHGYPSRVSEAINRIDHEDGNHIAPFGKSCGFNRHTLTLTPCVVGDGDHIRWVVLGDSHAGAILTAFAAAHPRDGILY